MSHPSAKLRANLETAVSLRESDDQAVKFQELKQLPPLSSSGQKGLTRNISAQSSARVDDDHESSPEQSDADHDANNVEEDVAQQSPKSRRLRQSSRRI